MSATTIFVGQTLKAQDVFGGFRQFSETFQVKKKEPGQGTGICPLEMNCIRQKGNREFPYPIKGHAVITNPPVFTWPMADYEYPETFPPQLPDKALDDFLRYDIQLGRTPDFSDKEAIVQTNLRLPFYNPPQSTAPGSVVLALPDNRSGMVSHV